MKKILQSVIDENKDNIGFVGTDSYGHTIIADKNNRILHSCYLGKNKFVDFDFKANKISIHRDKC